MRAKIFAAALLLGFLLAPFADADDRPPCGPVPEYRAPTVAGGMTIYHAPQWRWLSPSNSNCVRSKPGGGRSTEQLLLDEVRALRAEVERLGR